MAKRCAISQMPTTVFAANRRRRHHCQRHRHYDRRQFSRSRHPRRRTGSAAGAAISPWLFHSAATDPLSSNIGGIANITILPAERITVIGFDTGPGNGLMDAWTRQHLDSDLMPAANGRPVGLSSTTVAGDARRPLFQMQPPKSTGFEYFNLDWLEQFAVDRFEPADVQATLCELTAASIAAQLHSMPRYVGEVFVCGGGTHNAELMRRLDQTCPNHAVKSTRRRFGDPDWVEAVAFAWLAMRTINGQTGNLPSVTGATHKVVLGDIHSP